MAIESGENIKVVVEHVLPEDVVALNVFYYWTVFAEDQAEYLVMDDLKTQLEAIYTEIIANVVDGVDAGQIRFYKKTLLGWDLLGSRTLNVTYTSGAGMVAQGVSYLVRAYTAEPRVIGRKYIAGAPVDALTDGVIGGTTLTALAGFATEWGTTVELSAGNELWPGVYSTVHGFVVVMSGTMVVPVHPGYQRRRRPGVGI